MFNDLSSWSTKLSVLIMQKLPSSLYVYCKKYVYDLLIKELKLYYHIPAQPQYEREKGNSKLVFIIILYY